MSVLLGIHHAFDLSFAGDPDWTKVAMATWVAAAFGAGVGLIIVCAKALFSGGSHPANDRADDTLRLPRQRPVAPTEDAASRSVVVADAAAPVVEGPAVEVTATPVVGARPAGEAWLHEYMGRLRTFLPGLAYEGDEAPIPHPGTRLPKALPAAGGPRAAPRRRMSPDVTARMDAGTLDRMVQHLAGADPQTLVVPDMPTLALDMPALPALSADATIKTAALAVVEAEPDSAPATNRMHQDAPHTTLVAGSNGLPVVPRGWVRGLFEYGARRS